MERSKPSSLFCVDISAKDKKFYKIDIWMYKNLFVFITNNELEKET
jgi:hypothetical protein